MKKKKKKKINKYLQAYNIFMDYFDYLPEDIKADLDKDLTRIGL